MILQQSAAALKNIYSKWVEKRLKISSPGENFGPSPSQTGILLSLSFAIRFAV